MQQGKNLTFLFAVFLLLSGTEYCGIGCKETMHINMYAFIFICVAIYQIFLSKQKSTLYIKLQTLLAVFSLLSGLAYDGNFCIVHNNAVNSVTYTIK